MVGCLLNSDHRGGPFFSWNIYQFCGELGFNVLLWDEKTDL